MSRMLESIGKQLQRARRERGLSQAELATRLGRDRARISEFERELASNRMGRDRLTLLVEICDALGLVLVAAPRSRATEISNFIRNEEDAGPRQPARSVFDDLFVDLDEEGRG